MSYCVQCGVKLGDAEEKCPLCQTPVHNPAAPYDPRTPKPYKKHTEAQALQVNRRYIFGLITSALLIPAGICLVLDLLLSGGISWSLYPVGALCLLWIALCVPVLVRKYRVYVTISIASLALCGYLWLVEFLSSTEPVWFFPVALPAILLAALATLAMVASIRMGILRGLAIPAVVLLLIALLCFVIELLTSSLIFGQLQVRWSPFVMIPCAFVAIILLIIHVHTPLQEELKKRLHI